MLLSIGDDSEGWIVDVGVVETAVCGVDRVGWDIEAGCIQYIKDVQAVFDGYSIINSGNLNDGKIRAFLKSLAEDFALTIRSEAGFKQVAHWSSASTQAASGHAMISRIDERNCEGACTESGLPKSVGVANQGLMRRDTGSER